MNERAWNPNQNDLRAYIVQLEQEIARLKDALLVARQMNTDDGEEIARLRDERALRAGAA